MIKYTSVSVSYDGKYNAVENASFSVPKNSLTVLLGKNGSGKSTLLKCLYSQMKYSGKVTVDGKDIRTISARKRAEIISALPQRLLPVAVSVQELVSFGRSPYMKFGSRLSENDEKIINRSLELLGLFEVCDKRADRLSGGELQKAYVAMLLAQETPIVVLDEPTASMDIGSQKNLFELMTRIRSCGKTVITATHDLNSAIKYADNVVIVNSGKLAFCGSRDECLGCGAIETTFGVKRYDTSGRVLFD